MENMDLQRTFEQLFSPPLDSAVIAVIVDEYRDFDSCYDNLTSLVEEANSALERELNELSPGNSSSNFRGFSEPSSGGTGDESIASLEYSVDGLSTGDELDYTSNCSTTDDDERSQHYGFEYADFLKTCFPMFPEDRIDTLLQENDNNAEMVLDLILNEMYLEIEKQEEYFHSPISMRDPNYAEGNSLVSEPHYKHRKRKRLRKQQKNIIFQNNGHRPDSNRSNSPVTLGPPTSSSSSSSTSSCWNTPWVASSKNPHNKFGYESPDEFVDDSKLSQLLYLFPYHNFEDLKQMLVNCRGDVQNATETLRSNRRQIATQSNYQRSYKGVLQSKKRNDSIQDYDTISHKIYDDDDDYGLVDDEDGYDHGYCRKEALKCFKERDEAFKKASEAYRRKDGTASYHSDKGWEFDREMKKWNLRAARSLVKKQSVKRKDEFVLDLHGCSVKESLIIVKEWLNDWYPKRIASGMKPLQIITGKGNHSLNGVAKLPNAINKFLEKENWNITKHRGYVLVNGRG